MSAGAIRAAIGLRGLTDPPARRLSKIGVIGPGIVGMPMAALLARASMRNEIEGSPRVVVVQRRSPTSAWKVGAINAGQSPIGGVEPELDRIVAEAVAADVLRATHNYGQLRDADVILVCVQTDRNGFAPDYGPLFEALTDVAAALQQRPVGHVPLVVFESTLAPSSMATVIREHFARHGLREGRDILLGNSPNRVMPGRLVERVASSDKIVAGLQPETPALIEQLYSRVVTRGRLHRTNAMTAEVVKTLENAYRDVRIAYAAEIARYCDEQDVDFYAVREAVNARLAQTDRASADATAIPSGGLLVPTVGVGGHCLPKDGILLWWRKLETEGSAHECCRSLILEARRVNDESPAETLRFAERHLGSLARRAVVVLGAAYRADSEDTRNSASLVLAKLLLDRGCGVMIHDPYVNPRDQNLVRLGLAPLFTRDLEVVADADVVILCTAHRLYVEQRDAILRSAPRLRGVFDACNAYGRGDVAASGVTHAGIGRGSRAPESALVDFVCRGFRAVERGVANELFELVNFLNARYAGDKFNRVDFREVQRLAATCVTGCDIVDPGRVDRVAPYNGFVPRLVRCAVR